MAPELQTSPTTVAQLISRRPILVWPDTAVSEVAELLDRHGITAVPVVDWTGYLVGVVSQMDLLRVRQSESLWAQWPGLEARHVMSRPALTITADTPLGEAARRLDEAGAHRLVVVDDDGESPIGIVSASDVIHALATGVDL